MRMLARMASCTKQTTSGVRKAEGICVHIHGLMHSPYRRTQRREPVFTSMAWSTQQTGANSRRNMSLCPWPDHFSKWAHTGERTCF